jgi:hypothetical protein
MYDITQSEAAQSVPVLTTRSSKALSCNSLRSSLPSRTDFASRGLAISFFTLESVAAPRRLFSVFLLMS